MERHERYDPEDIESLLSERAFDELLADERAFVLRHISGRDEYERMRALLHYVRPDERERGTIEPEDRVKRNVIATFRAQQQPQWRIWLNTLATWLAPGEASATPLWRDKLWRPTLAFASLALLIIGGVVVVRQFHSASENIVVAELKNEERPAPAPPAEVATDNAAGSSVDEADRNNLSAEVDRQSVAQERVPYTAENKVAHVSREAAVAYDANVGAEAESATEDVAFFAPVMEEAKYTPVEPTAAGTATAESLSHVVTSDELARNMSTSNVTGRVMAKDVTVASKSAGKTRAKFEDGPTASRSVAQDPRVLDLVTAGW